MKKILLVCTIAILISSCEDKVKIDIPFKGEELVVEAFIDVDNIERQFVKLSTTSGYTEESSNKPVKDATVALFENDTIRHFMWEDLDGIYKFSDSTIKLKYNTNYRLLGRTNTAPLIKFRSDIQSISEPLKIDSMTIFKEDYLRENGLLFAITFVPEDEERFYPAVSITDDPSNRNFLTWNVYRNQTLLTDPKQSRIFTDSDYANGAKIPFENLWIGNSVSKGNNITVEQVSINEDTYNYINNLKDLLDEGTPFSTPPAPLISNIKSENPKEQTIHGFFTITSSHSKTIMF